MTCRRRIAWAGVGAVGVAMTVASLALVLATRAATRPCPDELPPARGDVVRARVLDREGRPISVTFQNPWNVHDRVALHSIPELLRRAMIEAEDRRFLRHRGPDWVARLHAVVQNVRAGRGVRGASTLTEQVVRMLHPRTRSVWARWVEGFEAAAFENRFSKGEILEFYLNQVPYARRRRGVVQAARDVFDRDLDTLSPKEMLALAVLVRSPARLDPQRSPAAALPAVARLAERMIAEGLVTAEAIGDLGTPFDVRRSGVGVEAPHFVQYARRMAGDGAGSRASSIRTTLDAPLQRRIDHILRRRVDALQHRGVGDGAVLVVENDSAEVLAWVNAGGFSDAEGSHIDAVVTPRQPGSTLKPFVYAVALEHGWTAATLIDDSPLAAPVGAGLHRYRNYSRVHHGPIRLREALGNSLNVPAVRVVQRLGVGTFRAALDELAFESLERHTQYYGEGLALGNGEVTLLEIVGAYATLARGGTWRPVTVLRREVGGPAVETRIFDAEVASLIADILSDPAARSREFGRGGALDLPVQTAVKTGTSNDYRDAWAIGFSDRHTVGVWLGNLDRHGMDGITGSIGPAVVLRSVFAELRRDAPSAPLRLSRKLAQLSICARTGRLASQRCPAVNEWFRPHHRPTRLCKESDSIPAAEMGVAPNSARWAQPTPGLHLARDPRIPDDRETFPLRVETSSPPTRIEWYVDGDRIAVTGPGDRSQPWPLAEGRHLARARVWLQPGAPPIDTPEVAFTVK